MASWREENQRVYEAGGTLVGASLDSVHSHRVFAQALGGLPYPLVSDWNRTVARAYGVYDEQAGRNRRSVFVIDPRGILRYANTSFNARAKSDYDEVIRVLSQI